MISISLKSKHESAQQILPDPSDAIANQFLASISGNTVTHGSIIFTQNQMGGAGKEDNLDVLVEIGARSQDPDAKLNKVIAWLGARPDVKSLQAGQEFDLWHWHFVDM